MTKTEFIEYLVPNLTHNCPRGLVKNLNCIDDCDRCWTKALNNALRETKLQIHVKR